MTSSSIVTVSDVYNDLAPEMERQGIQALLPSHITLEAFLRTAAVAIVKDPNLALADRQSVILALTKCATEGLIPDGREAALVVYSTKVKGQGGQPDTWIKKAQYMPMVDGVLKRARQSNQIDVIAGKAVFEGDQFDYWMDENGEHINYKPKFIGRGEFVLAFAFAKLKSGELVVEVMPKEEIDRVRSASKGADSGAWKDWYDRMAVKSVLHRLARRLPNASELMSMLEQGMIMNWQEQERDQHTKSAGQSKAQLVLEKVKAKRSQQAVTVNGEAEQQEEDFSRELSMHIDSLDSAEDLAALKEAYNLAWQWASTKQKAIQEKVKNHAGAVRKRLQALEEQPA